MYEVSALNPFFRTERYVRTFPTFEAALIDADRIRGFGRINIVVRHVDYHGDALMRQRLVQVNEQMRLRSY